MNTITHLTQNSHAINCLLVNYYTARPGTWSFKESSQSCRLEHWKSVKIVAFLKITELDFILYYVITTGGVKTRILCSELKAYGLHLKKLSKYKKPRK